jgi:hypothetical protein
VPVFTPTTRAAPPDPGHDPTVTRLRIWRLGFESRGALKIGLAQQTPLSCLLVGPGAVATRVFVWHGHGVGPAAERDEPAPRDFMVGEAELWLVLSAAAVAEPVTVDGRRSFPSLGTAAMKRPARQGQSVADMWRRLPWSANPRAPPGHSLAPRGSLETK